MPVPSFSQNLTQIPYESWSSFKAAYSLRNHGLRTSEEDDQYVMWFYDDHEIHIFGLSKELIDDISEFESAYLPSANGPLSCKTSDGRYIVKPIQCSVNKHFGIRTLYIKTSTLDGVVNMMSDGVTPNGDTALSFLASDGTSTDVPGLACRTIIDYEPKYDYDGAGGWVVVDPTLENGTTDAWYFSCVVAPDIPAESGGSIEAVAFANLEMLGSTAVSIDPKMTTMTRYDPLYHSGKIRFIFNHPTGEVKRFQIFLEEYR